MVVMSRAIGNLYRAVTKENKPVVIRKLRKDTDVVMFNNEQRMMDCQNKQYFVDITDMVDVGNEYWVGDSGGYESVVLDGVLFTRITAGHA